MGKVRMVQRRKSRRHEKKKEISSLSLFEINSFRWWRRDVTCKLDVCDERNFPSLRLIGVERQTSHSDRDRIFVSHFLIRCQRNRFGGDCERWIVSEYTADIVAREFNLLNMIIQFFVMKIFLKFH